jgi:MFS family permease
LRDKAISWVLAGGILGAEAGPNLAVLTKDFFDTPFLGAYLTLTVAGILGLIVMNFIHFPDEVAVKKVLPPGRSAMELLRQPVFMVAAISSALGYGVMNLLMAATPLAMKVCGLPFSDAALVLQWHVIGMFAPGFFTGSLIKKFGTYRIMILGIALNFVCILIALSGVEVYQFLLSSFILGVGWNFLFTGATSLAMTAYRPEEKDKAQGIINFFVFATMAITSFSSGALVTTSGWDILNFTSLFPVVLMGVALLWLRHKQNQEKKLPAI